MDEKAKGSRVETPEWLGEVPWLVYTHGNSKRKQVQTFYSPFLDSKSKPSYCLKSIPQLRNMKVVMSQHGWLLLQHRTQVTNLSLFNPLTSQTIVLPPLLQLDDDDDDDDDDDGDDDDDDGDDDDGDEEEDDVEDANDDDDNDHCLSLCLLTLPPDGDGDGDGDGDDCMLLLSLDKAGLLAFCHPAHPNCSWVTQPLELQGEAVKLAHLVAVASNGSRVIYGITYSDVLFCAEAEAKADLKSHLLTLKPLHTIVYPDHDFNHSFRFVTALESCGHLYCVLVYGLKETRQIMRVQVLEFNLQQKHSCSWVEVKSLNGRTFFINQLDASWCWGDSTRGIAPNCIYWSHEETLCLYNLLDQTCITLSPWSTLVSPCDFPFWFIPHHHHQQQQCRLSASEESKESSIQKTDFVNEKVNPSPTECQHNDGILSKLPLDLIELVANQHMRLFEYWSFRVCCKMLISRLPEPHHRSINDRPLFMVFNQDDRLCTIIDPCQHDSRSNNSVLPSHPHYYLTLEFIQSGWVFYLVGKKFLEYANVLTRVHGRFPSLPTLNNFDIRHRVHKSIAFSTYPTCSKCISVAIYGDDEKVAFSYIRPGDGVGVWRTSYFEHEHHPFRPTHSTPVFINGAFYYLDASGYLGEFRLTMDEATWVVYHNKPLVKGDKLYLSALVECNGQLYSLLVGNMGKWIRVFRFNYSRKYWVEIHHLGNLAFFISRKSSLSIVTNDDQMRNKIFLPCIRDKTIVYYSLSTRKYHIGGLDSDNLFGLGEPQWSCWF